MQIYRKLNVIILSIVFTQNYFFVSANENVTIIANEIVLLNQGSKLKVSGNVKIQYGTYQLTTTELTYDKKKNLITANHPVELKNKNVFKVLASSAQISDDFKEIIASQASAIIEKIFYIKSKEMERFRDGKSSFYSSIGTTCEVCPSSPVPMWQIKSDTILHDPIAKQLNFKNARMEFLGLPVFYTLFKNSRTGSKASHWFTNSKNSYFRFAWNRTKATILY